MITDYTTEVYNILNKYNIRHTESGVNTNLNEWKTNKGALVSLLRKHPNWNEKAMAVIFKVTENREIDADIVRQHRKNIYELSLDLELTSGQRSDFNWLLCVATDDFAKTLLTKSRVELLAKHDIKCSVGQKTSRIVNKLCKKFGVDKHPKFNALFAKLSDSLSPLLVERSALLSVHPGDYLEMSNKDNSWSSCHRLNGGEYSGGTLSYMNDGISMIFYTVDNDVTDNYHKAPKRTREVFCYKNGILLQSRLYPNKDDADIKDTHRNIVQQVIATCLNVPNLWVLKKDKDVVKDYCQTYSDSLHYPDYIYDGNGANISLLKAIDTDEDNELIIGHVSYCVECSSDMTETRSCGVVCQDCYNIVVCADCNSRVDRRNVYRIDGECYCPQCVTRCGHCGEYTRGETHTAVNRYGNTITICNDCRDDFIQCAMCNHLVPRRYTRNINNTCYCYECAESRQVREREALAVNIYPNSDFWVFNDHMIRSNEDAPVRRRYIQAG